MKYFVIAGEASGDLHAANLINALHVSMLTAQYLWKRREPRCFVIIAI